jgi:hypothetical protein
MLSTNCCKRVTAARSSQCRAGAGSSDALESPEERGESGASGATEVSGDTSGAAQNRACWLRLHLKGMVQVGQVQILCCWKKSWQPSQPGARSAWTRRRWRIWPARPPHSSPQTGQVVSLGLASRSDMLMGKNVLTGVLGGKPWRDRCEVNRGQPHLSLVLYEPSTARKTNAQQQSASDAQQ